MAKYDGPGSLWWKCNCKSWWPTQAVMSWCSSIFKIYSWLLFYHPPSQITATEQEGLISTPTWRGMKRKTASFPGSKGIFHPKVFSCAATISHLTSKNWNHEGWKVRMWNYYVQTLCHYGCSSLETSNSSDGKSSCIITYSFFSETYQRKPSLSRVGRSS